MKTLEQKRQTPLSKLFCWGPSTKEKLIRVHSALTLSDQLFRGLPRLRLLRQFWRGCHDEKLAFVSSQAELCALLIITLKVGGNVVGLT